MFRERWMRPLVGVLLVASIAVVAGCGKRDSGERVENGMMGKIPERATGRGTVEKTETDVWPADIMSDVPRFGYGVVERVTRARDGDGRMTKFVVRLRDIEDGAMGKYEADLRRAGWQPQMAVTTQRGGMVIARKGNLSLTLAYDAGKRQGDLSVYTDAR